MSFGLEANAHTFALLYERMWRSAESVKSVAALESVLIRLYLESPIGGGLAASVPTMDGLHGVGMGGPSMDGNHNHHGAGT